MLKYKTMKHIQDINQISINVGLQLGLVESSIWSGHQTTKLGHKLLDRFDQYMTLKYVIVGQL